MHKFIFLIFMFAIVNSCGFSGGSYPYAETYTVDLPEEELIELIQQFEDSNPEYKVPDVTIDGKNYFRLKNGRFGKDDYWFHFYIYYAKENSIVHLWTRPLNKDKTIVAFVGVNQGLRLGQWKLINKDFGKSENKEEIRKFEDWILNKLRGVVFEN